MGSTFSLGDDERKVEGLTMAQVLDLAEMHAIVTGADMEARDTDPARALWHDLHESVCESTASTPPLAASQLRPVLPDCLRGHDKFVKVKPVKGLTPGVVVVHSGPKRQTDEHALLKKCMKLFGEPYTPEGEDELLGDMQ